MEDGNDMLIYTPGDRLKIMSDGKMCVCKEIYRWELIGRRIMMWTDSICKREMLHMLDVSKV